MRKKRKPLSKKKLLRRLRNKAYKLWRQAILTKWDSQCVFCGDTVLPNAHHIVPKVFASLRYDSINGIILCPRNHKFNDRFSAHKNSLWFVALLVSRMPKGELKYLMRMMNKEGRNKLTIDVNYYEEAIRKLEDEKRRKE